MMTAPETQQTGRLRVSCPWPTHEDRNTSALVRLDAGKWQCWDCGAEGLVVTEPMARSIGDRMQDPAECAEGEHLWGLGFTHDALLGDHPTSPFPFPSVEELGDMLWRCIRCAETSPLGSDLRPVGYPPFSIPLPGHRFPPQPPSGPAPERRSLGNSMTPTATPETAPPAITILRMGTPDGTSELRCTSCGIGWTAGGLEWNSPPDLGVSRHINQHHCHYVIKDIHWADRDKHFPGVA